MEKTFWKWVIQIEFSETWKELTKMVIFNIKMCLYKVL